MNANWKVATYNVNSIRARLPVLLEWLKREQPDVLALQETKVQDEQFPLAELTEAGYYAAFKGQKSYNGVAILTKTKPDLIKYGLDGWGQPDEARLVAVQVDGIHLVNTYIPQGRDPKTEHFRYKLDWLGQLRDYFSRCYQTHEPIIWVGDFNVAPDERDVYAPDKLLGSVGFHPDEHAALEAVRAWGFVDIFRRHVPDGGHYTFWDYRIPNGFKRRMGWRIDHIWATEVMAERSIRAWVDTDMRLGEKPSDHAPLIAEFLRTAQ